MPGRSSRDGSFTWLLEEDFCFLLESKSASYSVMSNSLWPHELYVAYQSLLSMDFPSKDIGVGSYSFVWGIFLIQGSNMGLLHCRQIIYHLSYQGRPVSYRNCQKVSELLDVDLSLVAFYHESESHSVTSNSVTPWTIQFSRQEYWNG